ncbi:MAG: hypothetical protein ACLTYN_16100 [Dysosmobacter welbionis]
MSDTPKQSADGAGEAGPYRWAVQVFFLAIVLSAALALRRKPVSGRGRGCRAGAGGVYRPGHLFDIIGVAVTAADPRPLPPWPPTRSPAPGGAGPAAERRVVSMSATTWWGTSAASSAGPPLP